MTDTLALLRQYDEDRLSPLPKAKRGAPKKMDDRTRVTVHLDAKQIAAVDTLRGADEGQGTLSRSAVVRYALAMWLAQ